MRMEGKVAIVTGAGSGIGRSTALRLAAEGAAVACVDRVAGAARDAQKAIEAGGGQALAIAADVTDEEACRRMVEETVARFGRLTTLVNSAGVRPVAADTAPPGAEFRRVVEANLAGTYLASRAAVESLRTSGGGAITNLASIYGLVGGSMAPSYAASKGGVVNLTRQLALNWAPAVRVNCVCPGVVETPLTEELRRDRAWAERTLLKYPLGRFGQPEEIAAAILYLSSDEAAWVTGVALPVDGGYTAI
jgi:NAD(P)-dependent dehydrogenase (short-subunit alcohol dehydrogenase family)